MAESNNARPIFDLGRILKKGVCCRQEYYYSREDTVVRRNSKAESGQSGTEAHLNMHHPWIRTYFGTHEKQEDANKEEV